MSKTLHLLRVRIGSECVPCIHLAVSRFKHPETTEPSVSQDPEQSCRSLEYLIRRDFETKRVGDPGDNIETDAYVRCIEDCAGTDASPVSGVEIFRPDLRWRYCDFLE